MRPPGLGGRHRTGPVGCGRSRVRTAISTATARAIQKFLDTLIMVCGQAISVSRFPSSQRAVVRRGIDGLAQLEAELSSSRHTTHRDVV